MVHTGTSSVEQHRHTDLIEAAENILTALKAKSPPAIIPSPKVTISVPVPEVVVEQAEVIVNVPENTSEPVAYEFTFTRGPDGLIKRVIARPI